jgi:hypothetical protein
MIIHYFDGVRCTSPVYQLDNTLERGREYVQLVPLHLIVISILFHYYKELLECIREIEELEDVTDDNTKLKSLENTKYLKEEEEEEEKERERET